MQRSEILDLLKTILARHGRATNFAEDADLAGIGFRSLDFSELALRVENAGKVTLTFDAAPLRAIRTVQDVLNFFETASAKK